MNKIKIVIAGPRGKMGIEAVKMVQNNEQFQLEAVIDRKHNGKTLAEADSRFSHLPIPIFTNPDQCFATVKPDVLIDLTTPSACYQHAISALNYGVRPIIGTTGMSKAQLTAIEELANEKQIGCIIAPNFAIGAILMMKFSQMAAKFFQDIEIIEMHHDQKLDAPSGTAVKTAELISTERSLKTQGHPNEHENIPGARGADFEGMKIHSVRLPGLIAHQQVMFGAEGETLTIRHDSYNRNSFMTGVKLAIQAIINLDTYVYGLENIME
ncbi:4-hydroxy-tetrahydrodipicolinate reductase [Bacillus kwashiorkori]|uniref:4-hydroxy-tetrahydrodipicolinate reductase n=1 Tax=Bacillus kwashiorkori TaxID=1522318 RepID=UPI000782ECD0|nr:4-hydroxy-tetrahydrodipicolinate reductase [Bacillus kwashiorkori]